MSNTENVAIPGLKEWARKMVADAPPLSDESRNKLRVLFGSDQIVVRPVKAAA